jgi:hypothetical protein
MVSGYLFTNQGSSRTSLASPLVEDSNRSSLLTSAPTFTISSRVRSSLLTPSKYVSPNHSWRLFSVLSPVHVLSIVRHFCCHRSGNASLAVSNIWRTMDTGVAMMLSRGGWPAMSSKIYEKGELHLHTRLDSWPYGPDLHSPCIPHSTSQRDSPASLQK